MVTRVGTCSRSASSRIQEPSDESGPALQYLFVFPAEPGYLHERVYFCETALSKEVLLNCIDSSHYGSGRVVHSRGAILHKREKIRFT